MKYTGFIDGLLAEAAFAKLTGDISWLDNMLSNEEDPIKRMLLQEVCTEEFLEGVRRDTSWIRKEKTRLESMALSVIQDEEVEKMLEQMTEDDEEDDDQPGMNEDDDEGPEGGEEGPLTDEDGDAPSDNYDKEGKAPGRRDEGEESDILLPGGKKKELDENGEEGDEIDEICEKEGGNGYEKSEEDECEQGEGEENSDEEDSDGDSSSQNKDSKTNSGKSSGRHQEKDWEKMRKDAMKKHKENLQEKSLKKALNDYGGDSDSNHEPSFGIGGGPDRLMELENKVLKHIPRSLKRLARMIGRTGGFDVEVGRTFSRASKSDISGITTGNDMNSLLPSEIAVLSDRRTQDIFYKNYAEKRLQVFASASSGEKKKRRQDGPVIICLDTSGSMEGEPAKVAKMLTVAVSIYAMRMKRKVLVIKYSDQCYHEAFKKRRTDRLRLMKFLSWCGMGGNDENRMFRFLFKELLPNEEMFDSSDILCISDFGWCGLDDDVKELIAQAKNGGMKFYGLAVADHLWMGFGPEEAMNTMDSKWQWHGGECISLNEDKKEE